jgi:hypothetical protein
MSEEPMGDPRSAKDLEGPQSVSPEKRAPLRRDTNLFDMSELAAEIAEARSATKPMVRGMLARFATDDGLTMDHLAFFGFVERAQAFHEGVIDMVAGGNPLGAATLLRSFAENLAVAFYLTRHPREITKLHPGAEHGLPMGKVVAAAQQSLPGFKSIYKVLSDMAHPSGAGAFQTLQVEADRRLQWQSKPAFQSLDQARTMLRWLEEVRDLTGQVIEQTAKQFDLAAKARVGK